MKKSTLLAVILIAICTLSFKSISKAPPATTFTDNQFVPFVADIFIPCADGGAGETVHLEGTLHVQTHVTINGNNISTKFHNQPQGVAGVGLTTGDQYHATGVTQQQEKGSLTNGQYETTFVNNFRIIGQGPGNNFLVHQTFHVTVNANGTVTAFVDNFSAECK